MATIKISQLPSIGNAVAANTLLPVVNTAGVYTTDKASVAAIGNFVLTQAGNTLPAAFLSTYSQTVTNAAQPNITSTGTLSNLTVSGNANISLLNVDGVANLGSASNVVILGGDNGYFLQTDGAGNLTWAAGTGGGGNGTPGGSNTQVQFNDAGNFSGQSGFTFNKTNSTLAVGNINITSNLTGDYAVFTHDVTSNVLYANFLYGDGSNITNLPVGNITSVDLDGNVSNVLAGDGTWITKASISGSPSGSNTQVQYNNNGSFGASSGLTYNNITQTLTSGNLAAGNATFAGITTVSNNTPSINAVTGALKVTGGIGAQGNIHSGGEIHSFGNVKVGGQSLFVGASADATGLTNPTLVIFHSGANYVQAALKNSLSSGSADWVAYGDDGTEEQGWADFGFTSSEFNDPNYTITGPGDGYFFVESFAGSYGGNLVIATGDLGTVNDIIFATGGFDSADEFARIEDSNNLFHLTRTGSGIKFHDGTIQTTAYTGSGDPNKIVNGNSYANITNADGNLNISANGALFIFGTDGNFTASGNLLPNANITYDLGSPTKRWKDLWIANSTIYLGNVAVGVSDSGQISTSEIIVGGEGIGGISYIEWTTASELSIRTENTSSFVATFESLKINDTFTLLTGSDGTFPPNTNVSIVGTITQTTPVLGYIDFTIPIDAAAGTNVYVYTFNLTRAQLTNFSQLTGNTINLGNAVLTSNGNSLVVDSITITNGNVGEIGNIASINLDGNVSNVLSGSGSWVSIGSGATGPQGATGPAGASGPGFVWQGAWNTSGSYVGGQDVVSYGGGSYIKIGDGNSGSPPPADPIRWGVMADPGSTGATGPAGADGATGPIGATGVQGATGSFSGTLTANLDANTYSISNVGNVTASNLIASANVLSNGYARFSGTFDESQGSTAGLYLGYAGGTPRMMFGTGNTLQTFEIDNDGGNLRFYQPGSTKATLTSAGDFSVSGNITAGKLFGSLANGNSNVSIATANGNVTIAAVGNTTMTVTGTGANVTGYISATGNVTGLNLLATNASGNEGGEIQLAKPPNGTLGGGITVDAYIDQLRFFEQGGTARGAYIDLTQAAAGVGTLLNNRVSGLVNAGTFVTMDLLKATVTTSGNRGLSLAATTGSFSIYIGGSYSTTGPSASGAAGSGTINTTPSASQFNWNFTGAGDTSTYIITDTTNSRAYRITLQIGGSYLNNLIVIERLV